MTKLAAITSLAIVSLGLLVGAYFALYGQEELQCRAGSVAGGSAAIGGPFTLVDQSGQTVTEKDVIDELSLVYFGFTYCPDVCPLDVARNVEAIDILKEQGVPVTPVFITIDPARDTPEVLADYAVNLHPDMIALTGSDAQIKAASKAYKTYYRKNGEGEDYLMDHSTHSYLMDENGFLDFFRRDLPPEEVAERIGCFAGGS